MTKHLSSTVLVGILNVLLLFQIGCSDWGDSVDPEFLPITGSWRWAYTSGGFAYTISTPKPGTTLIDTYSPRGEFARRLNGILQFTAQYSLKHENGQFVLRYVNIQTVEGYPTDPFYHFVQFERDTLRLQDPGADLYQHTYARLR